MPKEARPELTKSEAVYAAESSGREMIVYRANGRYHLISAHLKKYISRDAVIVYRTQKEQVKTFRYEEGGRYVREQIINGRGQIVSERHRLKPKVRMVKEAREKGRDKERSD